MSNDISIIPVYDSNGTIKARIIVDSDDYAWLGRWRWSLDSRGYAKRTLTIGGRKGSKRTILMHRLILGLDFGDSNQVDHINRNIHDNRRCNLRIVTCAQQQQNRGPERNTSSKYRGVSFNKNLGKWQAQVRLNGHQSYLGVYDNEKDAAIAAQKFRISHMPYAIEETLS